MTISKKSVKEIVIMVAILVAIALVAGALLAVMYNVTKLTEEEIAARNDKIFQGVYASSGYEKLDVDSDIGPNVTDVRKTDDGSYILVVNGEGGYGGSVQFYIAIHEEKITNIVLGEHGETPGKYDAVAKQSHWKQYTDAGMSKELALGSDISAVSGSTKTSTAMNNAVNASIVYFNNVLNKAPTFWTAEAEVDELIIHPIYKMTNIKDPSKVVTVNFGYAVDASGMYATISSLELNGTAVESALVGANIESGEFTASGDAEEAALEAISAFNLKYAVKKINSLYDKVTIKEGSTKENATIVASANDFSSQLSITFTIKDGKVTEATGLANASNAWGGIGKVAGDFNPVNSQFVGKDVETLIKASLGNCKGLDGGESLTPVAGATVTSSGMMGAAQLASRAYLVAFGE